MNETITTFTPWLERPYAERLEFIKELQTQRVESLKESRKKITIKKKKIKKIRFKDKNLQSIFEKMSANQRSILG